MPGRRAARDHAIRSGNRSRAGHSTLRMANHGRSRDRTTRAADGSLRARWTRSGHRQVFAKCPTVTEILWLPCRKVATPPKPMATTNGARALHASAVWGFRGSVQAARRRGTDRPSSARRTGRAPARPGPATPRGHRQAHGAARCRARRSGPCPVACRGRAARAPATCRSRTTLSAAARASSAVARHTLTATAVTSVVGAVVGQVVEQVGEAVPHQLEVLRRDRPRTAREHLLAPTAYVVATAAEQRDTGGHQPGHRRMTALQVLGHEVLDRRRRVHEQLDLPPGPLQ